MCVFLASAMDYGADFTAEKQKKEVVASFFNTYVEHSNNPMRCDCF